MRHCKSDDASSTHEQFGIAGFRSPADQSQSSLLVPGVGAGAGGSMSSFGGGAGYYGRGSVSEASEVSTYSAAGPPSRYLPSTQSSRAGSIAPSVSDKYSLDPAYWIAEHAGPEPDDYLHNPDPKRDKKSDKGGTIFTIRGLMNLGCLVILIVALMTLFAGYPIITHFTKNDAKTLGAFNLGGVNGSGQVPQTIGNFGLIDNDTPKDKYHKQSAAGDIWELVFSDEFDEAGRTFYPGDDPYWEAIDLHAWGTNDLEWYDPRQLTTKNGNLQIQLSKEKSHDLDYLGGSMQTWNKFCFSGGRLEASIRLPAKASIYGLWPAFWTMGNLGRVGYGGTLEGLWPYSYDSCDAGTLPNQTMPDGTPSIARTSGTDEASNYALSYLPGQRLSACTCPEDETHPGPKRSDGSFVGRSAPEIDVIEAQTNAQTRIGEVSLSSQWAPFNPGYNWLNETHMIIEDDSVTHLNTYKGGVFQETTSGVADTNQDCYETAQDGTEGCFAVYAIEYRTGPDGYIKWFNDDKLAWTYLEGGMGPVAIADVGNRPVPDEPMYILFNLAMSYNFGPIDLDGLEDLWPVTMEVDYVRVYQDPTRKNIGCDNDDRPTAEYIKRYEHAYNDPNITTWDQMTNSAPWPKNRLIDQCAK